MKTMKVCSNCNQRIQAGFEKKLRGEILCDDCYIDEVVPKIKKAHYNNDAEFMNRLKDSYSVRPQQNH